jgi:hypothetical protein
MNHHSFRKNPATHASSRGLSAVSLAAAVIVGFAVNSTRAQETEYPLAVVHAASVERLQRQAEVVFSTAGRDDINAKVQEWMHTSLLDLKGMDRTRPFGMMIYLKPGLGGLSGIAYAPVENLDDFLQTLSLGSGNYRPVEGKPNRYTVSNDVFPNYVAMHRDGYLFLTAEEDAAELDRKFPAPEKLVQRLNSRYDLAFSLMIKSIPPATRQLFVTFLQTQTMAELQQRDDEPEAAYRVRKANGENTLDLLEKIITQGEELTIGGRIDSNSGLGEIDLEVAGTPDSKLAKFFQGMVGRRSLFANILSQPSMMTMGMSWQLDEKQRKAFIELFTLAPAELDRQAAKDGVEGTKPALEPLFRTLLQSAESGHLDGFVQITGHGEGGFAVLAGARVTGGANLPRQLADVLSFAKEKFSGNDRIANLELNVDQIDGLAVHALPLTPPDRPGRWMYGEGAKLYVYATTQALWLSFGGDAALPALKAGVAAAKKPAAPGEERKPRVPFLFYTHASEWVTVQSESRGESERPVQPQIQRFREEVKASFDERNDGLRLQVRPTDSGARLEFQFEKGWVGLLGRMIALRIERGSAPRPAGVPVPRADQDAAPEATE